MTESERITALEARLAKAEARIAELEGRMPLGVIWPRIGPNPGPGTPIWPDPLPGWPLPPIVTKTGDLDSTMGLPRSGWTLPATGGPGAVIHCGPDGPVAIKPEKDNGERSGSASGPKPPLALGQEIAGEIRARREIRQDAENGNPAYKRWLGTV